MNEESLEFMNRCVDLSFDARFNLLLVLRKARPSFLADKREICLIDEFYPEFLKTIFLDKTFYSMKRLRKKRDEETNCYYIGDILGYSFPMESLELENNKWTIFVEYYCDKKRIYVERVKYINQLQSKLEAFGRVGKEIGLDVYEQIIKKNKKKYY